MFELMNFGSGDEDVEDVADDIEGQVNDEGEREDVLSEHASSQESYLPMSSMVNFASLGDDDDDDYDDYDPDDEEEDEDVYEGDEDGEAAKTTDLSAVKAQAQDGPSPKSGKSIARIVVSSLAGIAGVACALVIVAFVAGPIAKVPTFDANEPVQVDADTSSDDSGEGDSETKAPEPTSALDDIVDTGNGYGVSKLVADSSSETISLRGRIRNLGKDMRENVALGIYLYDGDGSVIGVATGFVDRIEPGETCEFVATSEIATADVGSVALAEVRW